MDINNMTINITKIELDDQDAQNLIRDILYKLNAYERQCIFENIKEDFCIHCGSHKGYGETCYCQNDE